MESDIQGGNDLIEALVEAREKRGLTQREMAKLVGCPQSTIARIESKKVSPRLIIVMKMAKALGAEIKLSNEELPIRINKR